MRLFWILLLFQLAHAQDFKKPIQYLSSDSLHGRAPGTNDELKAANYITASLSLNKFNIRLQKFSFTEDSGIEKKATNIICYLKRNKINDSAVILIAHYDGLGIGSSKSLEVLPNKKLQIHNGADDNASGVAMILKLGKSLSKQKKLHYNLILLFTSAHEAGLFGSENFVKNNIDSLKIKAVLNFDMLGRLDNSNKILTINNNQKDTIITNYLIINKDSILHLSVGETNVHNSDLRHFENYNIPLLNFTTGTHDDYHKHTDDADKINYAGMKLIYQFMAGFLKYLNN